MTTAANTQPIFQPTDPCSMVLMGASGDLSRRMVVPALFRLSRRGILPPGFRLIGYARDKWTEDEFAAERKRA